MIIGIIGAMPEEVEAIVQLLDTPKNHQIGGRTFTKGDFHHQTVVVVYSRVGKASSASTATTLINHFSADKIIFTGIAGAVADDLKIGDIVIGDQCIQHDMDASPLFPKYEIPLTNQTYFYSCEKLVEMAVNAAECFLKEDYANMLSDKIRQKFQLTEPAIKIGTIASGDQFISCPTKIQNLKLDIDNLIAVEMEGAAVSQICAEYQVPFAVIRTISDKANTKAPDDFNQFLTEITAIYAKGIIKHLLMSLAKA